jgi:quercetin dioxygenase-like cupin family protein
VEVGSIFKSPRVDEPVTRRKTRPVYALGGVPGRAVTYERLSAAFPGNILRSTLIHEPPGFRSEPMSHEGEEIFFIVEGSLTLEVDGERMILAAGDSAHFPSFRTHATWNHTTKPTTIFHTCTMDVFGDGPLTGEPETGLVVKRASPKEPKTRRGG